MENKINNNIESHHLRQYIIITQVTFVGSYKDYYKFRKLNCVLTIKAHLLGGAASLVSAANVMSSSGITISNCTVPCSFTRGSLVSGVNTRVM